MSFLNGLNAFLAILVCLLGVVDLKSWSFLDCSSHLIRRKLLTWTIDHRLEKGELFIILFGSWVSQYLTKYFINRQTSWRCIRDKMRVFPPSTTTTSSSLRLRRTSSVFIVRSLKINTHKCCSDESRRCLPLPCVKWELISAPYLRIWPVYLSKKGLNYPQLNIFIKVVIITV